MCDSSVRDEQPHDINAWPADVRCSGCRRILRAGFDDLFPTLDRHVTYCEACYVAHTAGPRQEAMRL